MSLLPIFSMSVLLLFAAVIVGFVLGRARTKSGADPERAHLVSVESAVLGLLALLLGFSFAMAVSRYEKRREFVVEEANAIGTALLRSRFVAEPHAKQSEAILRRYLDLRVTAAQYVDYGESRGLAAETQKLQQQLWAEVIALMRQDEESLANALFAETVNEVIDVYGARSAEVKAHVPGGVLAVLHLLAFAALSVVGYVEALADRRHWAVPAIVAVLIAVVMTLIVDLDRPRQGLISVSQKSMLDLKASLSGK